MNLKNYIYISCYSESYIQSYTYKQILNLIINAISFLAYMRTSR